ncbi:MAG: GNAT family N-acetyltransferase [Bacteroidia bacterium]
MVYRMAIQEDIPQLISLGLLAYGEYFPQLSEENKTLMETNLTKPELYVNMMKIGKGFVAEIDDEIVGMGFLINSGHPTAIYPSDWCYIRMIGINPLFKGKGIASKITDLCIQEALEKNEKTIGLHTSEMMPTAQHIYKKKGFVVAKELDLIFGKRYWLYQLNLQNE